MLTLTDPLIIAGIVIVMGFIGSRYWQRRSLPAYYLIRVAVFIGLTILLLQGGVVPYRPRPRIGSELAQFYVATLEITWWLGAAWVAVGFFRAFLVWGRQPRESKLIQDLLAGLIYLLAIVGIIADVFDLPVQGLLATSGAAAILIGLALQSSLGDVFSGLVLNLERPYRVGDWIIVDEAIQGEVIETNWRATHVLLSSHDVAVVPNSVIAKAKLINCSTPTPHHRHTMRVKLEPTRAPVVTCQLLTELLSRTPLVEKNPMPTVTVKDVSAEAVDIELAFTVRSIAAKDAAQNEIYDHLHRAAAASGLKFAPRLIQIAPCSQPPCGDSDNLSQLVEAIPLFASFTAGERAVLVRNLQRREFKTGETIPLTPSLFIVSDGVVVASVTDKGERREVRRFAPGDYIGERSLLTGEQWQGELSSLTPVLLYQLSKDAIAPLLMARPELASQLSQGSAASRSVNWTTVDSGSPQQEGDSKFTDRVANTIRRFFSTQ